MALVLELTYTSTQPYIKNYIVAFARKFDIKVKTLQKADRLFCYFEQKDNLEAMLEALAKMLPASVFLKASKSYLSDEEVNTQETLKQHYALGLGLCPSCQKELFDVSSNRYYYPFTSCSCCGGGYGFMEHYPYSRENTSMKYVAMCSTCKEEVSSRGLRENHHLNSCHKCGIPVRLSDKKSERFANDAGSFRTLFEVSAKAIQDNKRLLMKTTMGYRVFYKTTKESTTPDTMLMMCEADKITNNCSLISEEFQALLSIERPVLHVALKNEKLKEMLGYNTAFVKYPDDGFSILLAVELKKLGFEYVSYEVASADTPADLSMEFDLSITPQEEMRYFINKDVSFIAGGERVSFPYTQKTLTNTLSIAHNLAGVEQEGVMVFDRLKHFGTTAPQRVHTIGEFEKISDKQFALDEDEASFMSVIVEHELYGQKCVGGYFGENASFLYYNGTNIVRAVPPNYFTTKTLIEDIKNLREGSDRLVENLKKQLLHVYEKLELLEQKKQSTLFEALGIVLELEDPTFRGLSKEAMKFTGKGGIQIDTQVVENKFNYTALIASVISYKLAGVDNVILSYSFFESFGDYCNDIMQQIKAKTKAEHFILCGESFGNQSLFSRIYRNLKMTPPKMNKTLPIGKYNTVVGGAYM